MLSLSSTRLLYIKSYVDHSQHVTLSKKKWISKIISIFNFIHENNTIFWTYRYNNSDSSPPTTYILGQQFRPWFESFIWKSLTELQQPFVFYFQIMNDFQELYYKCTIVGANQLEMSQMYWGQLWLRS